MGGRNTEERDWGKREPLRIFLEEKRKERRGRRRRKRFEPRVPQQRGCSNVTVAEELTREGVVVREGVQHACQCEYRHLPSLTSPLIHLSHPSPPQSHFHPSPRPVFSSCSLINFSATWRLCLSSSCCALCHSPVLPAATRS